ncbi:MAG: PDZ domain-containing protein, partial [Gammaproteobacteria bacterium]|nr:PDZ domain-containing protein [Gammaproteobacteria bacterium]
AAKARGLGLPDTRGALVNTVAPGSAAAKAGIEPGDVIRDFNGAVIDDSSDLPPIVGALAPGSRAKVTILRDGKMRELDVTLSELDEAAVAAAQQPAVRPPGAAASNPLGLIGQTLGADERRKLGLAADEGVLIARVEGLAARSAGIQPGDVVLSVGRTAVDSPGALDRQLRGVKAGQTVMLLVRRGGATQFVAVTPRIDGADSEG